MANLTSKSKVKVMNNTTGMLSFFGMDDKRYIFATPASFKMVELSIIDGLYNDHPTFIHDGYIVFEDKKVYDYLQIPEEITSKIVRLDEIKTLLDKDAEQLKEVLTESPYSVKENVAITAKKYGLDSKKKTQAIEETTGFKIDEQPFDE